MDEVPAGSAARTRGEDPTQDPRASAWLEPGFRGATSWWTVDHPRRSVDRNPVARSAMADFERVLAQLPTDPAALGDRWSGPFFVTGVVAAAAGPLLTLPASRVLP